MTVAEDTKNEEQEAASSGAETPSDGNQDRVRIPIERANLTTAYSNFCQVTPAPEELTVDFGFTPHPHGAGNEPIVMNQRVIMNYYTAKKLLQVLHLTMQQHERAFGPVEPDYRKRYIGESSGGQTP